MPFYQTNWFEWLVVGCFLLLSGLLWKVFDPPLLGYGPEEANYIEIAHALRLGHWDQLIQVDRLSAFTSTPLLYPLVLMTSMFAKRHDALADWVPLFKMINLGLYASGVFLFHWLCRLQIRKPYPLLLTALFTVSPLTIQAVHSLTADMLYLNLSMGALIAIDSVYSKPEKIGTWSQIGACALLVLLCLLTRQVGYLLLLGYEWVLFRRVGLKNALIVLGIILACVLPLQLGELYLKSQAESAINGATSAGFRSTGGSFAQQLTFWAKALTEAVLGTLDFSRLDSVLLQKLSLKAYVIPFSEIRWVPWVLLSLMALGCVYTLNKNSGLVTLYLLLYLLSGCLLPVEQSRFLFPILPIALLALFQGMKTVGDWFRFFALPVSRVVIPAVFVLMLLNHFGVNFALLKQQQASVAAVTEPSGSSVTTTPTLLPIPRADSVGYENTLAWIKANTPPQIQVSTVRPSTLYTYTERAPLSLAPQSQFDGKSPQVLLEALLKSNYLLEERNVPWMRHRVTPLIEQYRGEHFQLVFTEPSANTRVWKVYGVSRVLQNRPQSDTP